MYIDPNFLLHLIIFCFHDYDTSTVSLYYFIELISPDLSD